MTRPDVQSDGVLGTADAVALAALGADGQLRGARQDGAAPLHPGNPSVMASRLRAAAVHLFVSVAIAIALVLLVTEVWYPAPLFELVQGRDIFFLIVGCDITLGPTMTLIIFNVRKPRKELVRDVAIIALVQLTALSYGVYALSQVRPAYIVFNVARFNVTMANELLADDGKGGRIVPSAPWTGPRLVGAKLPEDDKERSDMIFSALGGRGDVHQMPKYFVAYEDVKPQVVAHIRTVKEIAKILGAETSVVEAATQSYRQRGLAFGLVPLVIRQTTALAIVDSNTGDLIAIEPLHRQL